MDQHIVGVRAVVRRTFLFVLAVGALSACGDNLFKEGGHPPTLEEFSATAPSVTEGDTIIFTVAATGPRTVDRIRVVLSGALVKDTTFEVDDPSTDVSGEIRLAVPNGTGPGSELVATAYAIDVVPDTSESRTATVQITDATPPSVTGSATPTQSGAGETIDITVQATDNRGVAQLGAVVTDADGNSYDPTPATIDPAQLQVSRTFQLTTPGIDTGDLTITPFATDMAGLRSDGNALAVEISDLHGPTFLHFETNPDSTIPLGDSVQVIVELEDPAGIQQVTFVGLAYRGTPSMGTDEVVERFQQKTITFPRPTEGGDLPTSYTLNPYLIPVEGDETVEPVEIYVVATDGLGNVSDTTRMMFVGGPDVAITFPTEPFEVGLAATFDVQIAISDETGIDSADLVLTHDGAPYQTIDLRSQLPARTDTPFVLVASVTMPSTEGTVALQARAWNRAEVLGQSRTIRVDVQTDAPVDTDPPVVSVTAERLVPTDAGDRMELLDEFRVRVAAFDGNSGLDRVGLKIVASRAGAVYEVTDELTGLNGSRSLEELVYQVPLDQLYAAFGITDEAAIDALLPEDIDLRIHGFAVDMEQQLACSVGIEEQRSCDPTGYSATEFYEAANHAGLLFEITAVRGVTVLLDNRDAVIAGLALDSINDRVFLSNRSENLVEFLDLATDLRSIFFHPPVQVGAAPVGLFVGDRIVSDSEPTAGVVAGERARTLFVANSGGTNISLVHVGGGAAAVEEVDVVRLQTPNMVLYEISEMDDDFGNIRYEAVFYDFSDRPQFLAQDSLLRIVYSTLPTTTSPMGTLRYVEADPDPTSTTDRPEAQLLITGDMVEGGGGETLVLARVDSIDIIPVSGGDDLVKIFTHEPGYPDRIIESPDGETQWADAVADVQNQIDAVMALRGQAAEAPLYYPVLQAGTWNLEELDWSARTYVSASGDGGKIVIGEGDASPTGRIMMWHADQQYVLSGDVQIADLLNNASEEVLGVGLNQTGTLGVARGRNATYFFTPDLRLMGEYVHGGSGGAGAVFHPEHDELTDGQHTSGDRTGVAFTGTAENSIEVVNTMHFDLVTSLMIRDNVVGPLVAGPPLASDNGGQGAGCVAAAATAAEADACVVAKLYGITSAGGVVVVNVRRGDLGS